MCPLPPQCNATGGPPCSASEPPCGAQAGRSWGALGQPRSAKGHFLASPYPNVSWLLGKAQELPTAEATGAFEERALARLPSWE